MSARCVAWRTQVLGWVANSWAAGPAVAVQQEPDLVTRTPLVPSKKCHYNLDVLI